VQVDAAVVGQILSSLRRRSAMRCTALVALLTRWAERKVSSPAQLALAWLMAQKPWLVPIPGTTQMAHVLENIGASAVRFTPAELSELNSAVSAIEVHGARLPDGVLVFSGVEALARKCRPTASVSAPRVGVGPAWRRGRRPSRAAVGQRRAPLVQTPGTATRRA
jgi:Aldo/keto reductase family